MKQMFVEEIFQGKGCWLDRPLFIKSHLIRLNTVHFRRTIHFWNQHFGLQSLDRPHLPRLETYNLYCETEDILLISCLLRGRSSSLDSRRVWNKICICKLEMNLDVLLPSQNIYTIFYHMLECPYGVTFSQ